MDCIIPFCSWNQTVTQANVAKCATHHHFMIATTRSIGIEIAFFDSMFDQILACRACRSEVASRRYVIRCNRVIDHHQDSRSSNILDWLWLERHILEKWRLLYIRRVRIPLEQL